MFTWRDVYNEIAKREESLRQAEQERRIQAWLPARGARPRFHHILLLRLGEWLETIGCRLRTRYAAIGEGGLLTPTTEESLQRC